MRLRRKRSFVSRDLKSALVRVQPVVEKPWELGQEQITILKNSICKGATDDELKFCLVVAQRYKLDPFKRQIWFVPRWDKNADNVKGGKGSNVYTPQVGIDGLLYCASRDHRADFGSVSLPEFGPMKQIEWEDNGKTKKFSAPEWALVKVWKKGLTEPTEAQAYWDEYAPYDFGKAPFWRKMPRRMLAKCATALAIRQAYPDLGGIYIPEESERIEEGYTESGREITVAASGPGSKEAAQAVGKRIVEEVKAKIEARKQEKPEARGGIELDWSENEASPVVRGDIAELLETLKLNLHMTWGDDSWWHCEPRDAVKLIEICRLKGYALKEVLPAKLPVGSSGPSGTVASNPLEQANAGDVQGDNRSPASGSETKQVELPLGTPSGSVQELLGAIKAAEGKKPRAEKEKRPKSLPRAHIPFVVKATKWTKSGKGVEVTLDTGAKLYAFDNRKMGEDGEKLLDLLISSVNQECIFATVKDATQDKREFTKIKALLKMGDREWEEDGTPVLRRTREPGED